MTIETPCEIGDKIYTVTENPPYKIFHYKVTGFKVTAKKKVYPLAMYDIPYEMGVSAFKTREEAEKRIRELRSGV